jgi:hypothetical protein
LEEHITSIFRVEEQEKQEKLSMPPASAGFLHDFLSNTDDECNIFLQNVGLSLNYIILQPRIAYFS